MSHNLQAANCKPSSGFLMEPQNLQEAMQLAEMLANSALVPKAYQSKPGDVLIACQWGSEIGLKPLQALQNIAVINNVPAIWGDAVVALVRGSGLCEYIKQEFDPATKTAICRVKRRGEPEESRSFSEENARLAGHLSKDTYKKHLERMLSNRARAFALRDVFADVLKGIKVAEEVEDYPAERDITPTASQQHVAPANRTSAVLERIKSTRGAPTQQPVIIDAQPAHEQPVDHASAYADHCAALEEAGDIESLQSAFADARLWVIQTKDEAIRAGIKQIYSACKERLSQV
ncbi:MAG: hypothetical protein ACRC9N_00345 [Aeromonas sp.]